jgi:hypothetical protein
MSEDTLDLDGVMHRINEASPDDWDKASKKQVGGQHYKGMAIQPVDFIVANDIPYCEANAIKYICRHGLKGGLEDIDKAIHYLELLKELKYD